MQVPDTAKTIHCLQHCLGSPFKVSATSVPFHVASGQNVYADRLNSGFSRAGVPRHYFVVGCVVAAVLRRGFRRISAPKQRTVYTVRASSVIDDLQGSWEDDVGNEIKISGELACFSDGSGLWPVEDVGETLMLRGTSFVGTPACPLWRTPEGAVRMWERPTPVFRDGSKWRDYFLDYKQKHLRIRSRLWASLQSEDYAEASILREQLVDGPLPHGSFDWQARLAAGQRLATGVCFVHRQFGYRGVVVAGEAWCMAPASWRKAMGVEELARGARQPFYHSCVDERDISMGCTTFASEENMEVTENVFPVRSALVDYLFVPCPEIRGYLPKPMLYAALRRQREQGRFSWQQPHEVYM